MLAFNAAYCRTHLSKHWFTDVVTGLLYGVLLYAPFAAANWLIGGPPARPPGPEDTATVTGVTGRARASRPGQPALGSEREGPAAGVGEAVRPRPAAEHGR